MRGQPPDRPSAKRRNTFTFPSIEAAARWRDDGFEALAQGRALPDPAPYKRLASSDQPTEAPQLRTARQALYFWHHRKYAVQQKAGGKRHSQVLPMIAVDRLSRCERTRAYVHKRSPDGKADLDILRRLKRYIAREVYKDPDRRRPRYRPHTSRLTRIGASAHGSARGRLGADSHIVIPPDQ